MFELKPPYYPYKTHISVEESDKKDEQTLPAVYAFERFTVPNFIPLEGKIILKEKK